MCKYDLEYFIEKEKEGVIFAKISKSFNSNDVHGAYFPYGDYLGKVLNNEVCSSFSESTVEPLDVAFGYFHYGDQLTIVSFTKLADKIDEKSFEAYDDIKGGCYKVNNVFVEKVLSLNEPSTIDLFREYMDDESFFDGDVLAESHLRNWNCNRGADYLHGLAEKEKKSINETSAANEGKKNIFKQLFKG